MCNQKEEQDGNTNKRTVLEVRGPINLVGSRVHVSAADEVKNRWERHLGEARTVSMTIQHFIITYTRRFNYTRAIERWLILSPGTANFGLLGFEFIRLIRRRAPCAKSRKILQRGWHFSWDGCVQRFTLKKIYIQKSNMWMSFGDEGELAFIRTWKQNRKPAGSQPNTQAHVVVLIPQTRFKALHDPNHNTRDIVSSRLVLIWLAGFCLTC